MLCGAFTAEKCAIAFIRKTDYRRVTTTTKTFFQKWALGLKAKSLSMEATRTLFYLDILFSVRIPDPEASFLEPKCSSSVSSNRLELSP